ncbi:MAG: META domain-containing protein [Chitinispirillales bacterium]|nr:META domain-containing protein [Chitinispirillales bacterium]
MKEILFLLSVFILLVFAITNCDNTGTNIGGDCDTDTTLTDTSQKNNLLAGTSWKLAAIVDVENNVSREPDCVNPHSEVWISEDKLYTLSFVNDSVIDGSITVNRIFGLYSADYDTDTLFLRDVMTTAVCCDWGDGDLYIDVLGGLNKSRYFKLYSQELHIFYNNGKEYLKFNGVPKISIPQ